MKAMAGWRIRVLAMILPAAILMFGAIALAPTPGRPSGQDIPSKAAETQCLPIKPVSDVEGLNKLVKNLRTGDEFQGADVGADVTLQDGRRLWVFGDTLRARTFKGQRFVRNSMLVFTHTCAQVVLPADHGALIPDRADGTGYWPMSIAKVQRPGYDLVGVAAQRVRGKADPGNPGDFENLGPSIAVFLVRTGETPQLIERRDLGADNASRKRPMWGAAAAVDGDWIYLYGTANPEKAGVFGWSLNVARVKIDDILKSSQWRYWDGRSWQRNASRASKLIPAVGGVSQTLSVFHKGGRWYAVSKRDEFLGKDLVIWTAPGPTGPFTASPALATIPSDAASGMLRYMPLAHPDLLPEGGSIVVSVSQNNTDIAKVDDNPFLYRPRFLRVKLPDAG
jgi:hypothetical protein